MQANLINKHDDTVIIPVTDHEKQKDLEKKMEITLFDLKSNK